MMKIFIFAHHWSEISYQRHKAGSTYDQSSIFSICDEENWKSSSCRIGLQKLSHCFSYSIRIVLNSFFGVIIFIKFWYQELHVEASAISIFHSLGVQVYYTVKKRDYGILVCSHDFGGSVLASCAIRRVSPKKTV